MSGVLGAVAARYAGARVHRVEDPRLLTGHGTFVDDVARPGMLHACFVRSPLARARIVGVDVSEALALEGVHAVFRSEDLGIGTCTYVEPTTAGMGFYAPEGATIRIEPSGLPQVVGESQSRRHPRASPHAIDPYLDVSVREDQARTDSLPVEEDGARAADTVLAAKVRAGELAACRPTAWRSRPSRGSPHQRASSPRCRPPSVTTTVCSAVSAPRDSSSRAPRSCATIPTQPTNRSGTPCPGTSAAALATRASSKPSAPQPNQRPRWQPRRAPPCKK